MKNSLYAIIAMLAIGTQAFGIQLSQRLPKDATDVQLSAVTIGAKTVGYKSVDSGISCDSESNPNTCGIIQEPVLAPTLVADISYTSASSICHKNQDGGEATSCDAYLEVQITPAFKAAIKSNGKNLMSLVSSMNVSGPQNFVDQNAPSTVPVDCDLNEESGQYSGPNCHWVDGPITYTKTTAKVVTLTIQTK